MRQGQHPKKNRGRGRRQPNPVNRVFESNGPDVKIRGNASHISEKYLALARDAQSSGDPISAENYHQHAEHYLRIIAAANAQQQAQAASCSPAQSDQGEREANGQGNGHARDAGRDNGSTRDDDDDDADMREAASGDDVEADAPAPRRRRSRSGGNNVPDVSAAESADAEPGADASVTATGADEEVRDAG